MDDSTFQKLFHIDSSVEVRINVTNVCNLHCDFCDHDAHLPFDRHGSRLWRQTPLVATPEALEQFCEALSGVGEEDRHVLQGGEITVLPIKIIVRLIDVLHEYGRQAGMRTNGYHLTGIPLKSLNKLSFIYLNDHGNNREAIQLCYEYLKSNFEGEVIVEENYFHRDMGAFLHHGQGTVEQGLNCNHLMATLTYLPPLVHPCCNSWALMNALNTGEMARVLAEAGWTSDNPHLKDTLANWRQTLPKPFLKSFCANSCYLTANDKIESPLQRIQVHQLDRVLKH